LIEITIVIFLMALITGITAVAFVSALPQARLKAAARDLASTLKYARNVACATNEKQIVHLDLNTASYALNGREPKYLSGNTAVTVFETADQKTVQKEGTYNIVYEAAFGSNWHSISLSRNGKTMIIKADPVLTAITVAGKGTGP